MHAIAQTELVAIWVLWAWPYLFRAPKVQKRPSITAAGPSRAGLLLEAAGFLCVWWFRAPDAPRSSVFVLAAALISGALADFLMWNAITHLGRQFRIQAGLYEDHQLVRSGPYAVVRHPIYASLLWLILATGLLLSLWQWLVAGLALCVAGNEVRVRTEDRLLESRFGKEFLEYRKQVPAYLPFVR
jgi:protein-S-isoprenylcysteine O-methyltransferase Ste14